jgi:hypothetical protein
MKTAVFSAVITAVLILLAAAAGATQSGEPVLVEKGASVTAVVDEEDFDGLAATTGSGTTYFIWTPPSVDYEQLASFHRKYKNKTVTFKGDVYKDERGLYITIDALPEQ